MKISLIVKNLSKRPVTLTWATPPTEVAPGKSQVVDIVASRLFERGSSGETFRADLAYLVSKRQVEIELDTDIAIKGRPAVERIVEKVVVKTLAPRQSDGALEIKTIDKPTRIDLPPNAEIDMAFGKLKSRPANDAPIQSILAPGDWDRSRTIDFGSKPDALPAPNGADARPPSVVPVAPPAVSPVAAPAPVAKAPKASRRSGKSKSKSNPPNARSEDVSIE